MNWQAKSERSPSEHQALNGNNSKLSTEDQNILQSRSSRIEQTYKPEQKEQFIKLQKQLSELESLKAQAAHARNETQTSEKLFNELQGSSADSL